MNYQAFYQNTEKRLYDAILSLWATGDGAMQAYIQQLFEQDEPLLAKPVFQTSFPWELNQEEKRFDQLTELFSADFIHGLDSVTNEDLRFPADRKPYEHQLKSWRALLEDEKSIVVTTGTGSGKTECFMMPVLQDLHQHQRNKDGIGAIFLYPLNALIGSQKKRVDAWVRQLKGLRYAIYNGATEETETKEQKKGSLPELISRKQIRENPPQVLFTNPTMLEYILVRNKDADILNISRKNGSLRWILLDEAHTLSGSTATEMALLIRRVLDAFGKTPDEVRFAATSATAGGSEGAGELKNFMSKLTGLPNGKIEVINGRRVLNKANSSEEKVQQLRERILKEEALPLATLAKSINPKAEKVTDQLAVVDQLAEQTKNGDSVLPVRGHFFACSIGGVYVCTNPKCDKHSYRDKKHTIGTLQTHATDECDHCGHPMLELVACRSCNNHLLMGEKYSVGKNKERKNYLRLVSVIAEDTFFIEEENDEDETPREQVSDKHYFLARRKSNQEYITEIEGKARLKGIQITKEGELKNEADPHQATFLHAQQDDPAGEQICPHCGEKDGISNVFHFRISAGFLNRLLYDIILEQTPNKKYLAFTDSRHRTAVGAASINRESEQLWLRSQVFHTLAEKRKRGSKPLDEKSTKELDRQIKEYESYLKQNLPDGLLTDVKEKLSGLKETKQRSGIASAPKSRLTWLDLRKKLEENETSITRLHERIKRTSDYPENDYLLSLLYDEFAKRIPFERGAENLGLVSIVYPNLEQVKYPESAKRLAITETEWQDLLKIGMDYIIRANFHIELGGRESPLRNLTTKWLRSNLIDYFEGERIPAGINGWPYLKKSRGSRIHRFALLICAGLGWTSFDTLDDQKQQQLNALLEDIWKAIRAKVLGKPQEYKDGRKGYKLNLEEELAFELPERLWLCPVKNRLIDRHFRGYTPHIKGNLNPENIRNYKIKDLDGVRMPYFPYPFNTNEENVTDVPLTQKWLNENFDDYKNKHLWNDRYERIIVQSPLYLAGEHSAQQEKEVLETMEEKFTKGEINVLSCSTTMEMGVDLKGISTVVMNNVPPRPANYQQRAGRAGRRSEAKSLALTFCAPNPIGQGVMQNPMWPFEKKIAPPLLNFNSMAVVQRHVNAFFFGKFIQGEGGTNVKELVSEFFFEKNTADQFLTDLKDSDWSGINGGLRQLVKNTDLARQSPEALRERTRQRFADVLALAQERKKNFEETLEKYKVDYGDNSPPYKAVKFRFTQFKRLYLLSFLVQENFLPGAGLPTSVVDFETKSFEDLKEENKKENKRQENDGEISPYIPKPSFGLVRALSAYAPGNRIVINGWSYKSAGVLLKTEQNEAQENLLQSCNKCGYQRIRTSDHQDDLTQCPKCDGGTFRGMKGADGKTKGAFTHLIEPAGFATDIFAEKQRKIKEGSQEQYIEPLLVDMQPWAKEETSGTLFDYREGDLKSEILYINKGYGDGYAVCTSCGRTASKKDDLEEHKRLRGGKSKDKSSICKKPNVKENVVLGARLRTDIAELRFREQDEHGNFDKYTNDENLLWSLGVILTREFAKVLGIEQSEISFGVKKYQNYRSLFLFDNAKGGAGFATQFLDYEEEVFRNAYEALRTRKDKNDTGGCSCKKACTNCLIDRSSQWHIDKMDRNICAAWLKVALDQKVPQEVRQELPNAKPLRVKLKEELRRLDRRNEIKTAYLFIEPEVAEWSYPEWRKALPLSRYATELASEGKKLKLAIQKRNLDYAASDLNRLKAKEISGNADFFRISESQNKLVTPVCQLKLTSGKWRTYYTLSEKAVSRQLDESWLDNATGFYADSDTPFDYKAIKVEAPKGKTHRIELAPSGYFPTRQLASRFLREAQAKSDIKSLLKGKTFDLTYSDRYLVSPGYCLLLMDFVAGLRDEIGFTLKSFTVKTRDIERRKNFDGIQKLKQDYPYRLRHWRKQDLEQLAQKYDLPLDLQENWNTPHERAFIFKDTQSDKVITINPEAGIGHGWHFSTYDNADAYPGAGKLDTVSTSITKDHNVSKITFYLIQE